jgi:deoxyribonuclease-4
MLIGAHVSPAGGLARAVDRGVERGCESIQIFNQSPRMWKGRPYGEEEARALAGAMRSSPIKAVVIHAIYLLNCASQDRQLRAKSLASLTNSLRSGAEIGAAGVVLHPGSAKAGDVARAIKRAATTIRRALADSERCPLYLENTAGAGGTIGRSIAELAELIEECGGDSRLGVCLDSCHLFASGYDIRTPEGLDAVLDEVAERIGLERIGCVHLNDSQGALGSNRDRHANVGEGELGASGCATFLSAPQLEALPCVLETPGEKQSGPGAAEIALAHELRKKGVAARKAKARTRSRGRSRGASSR